MFTLPRPVTHLWSSKAKFITFFCQACWEMETALEMIQIIFQTLDFGFRFTWHGLKHLLGSSLRSSLTKKKVCFGGQVESIFPHTAVRAGLHRADWIHAAQANGARPERHVHALKVQQRARRVR